MTMRYTFDNEQADLKAIAQNIQTFLMMRERYYNLTQNPKANRVLIELLKNENNRQSEVLESQFQLAIKICQAQRTNDEK